MNISGAVEKSPSFVGDVVYVWSVWEGFLLGTNSLFEFAAVSVWSVGVNACLGRIELIKCYLAEFVAATRPSSSG